MASSTQQQQQQHQQHQQQQPAQQLKLCVVGAPNAGKSLLCRVLAEQPLAPAATATTTSPPLRVQRVTRALHSLPTGASSGGGGGGGAGEQQVVVVADLWDVAGAATHAAAWPALAKGVDGVVLVLDASQPQQEADHLERAYLTFAQPHSLAKKACAVVAVSVATDSGAVAPPPMWPGLRGKLSKLPLSAHVTIDPAAPEAGRAQALPVLDRLLAGALAAKREREERRMLGGGA